MFRPWAPETPVVEEIHATSCTVSYQPPAFDGDAPVTGYILERLTAGTESQWTRVNETAVPELQYVIENLTPGTEYQFRVAAVNPNLEGKSSGMSDVILTGEKPDKPDQLEVVEVIGTSVRLQWIAPVSDGGAHITEYRIMYRTSGATQDTFIYTDAITGSLISYTVRNSLQANTQYQFAVAAVNRIGSGPWSDVTDDVKTFAGNFHI